MKFIIFFFAFTCSLYGNSQKIIIPEKLELNERQIELKKSSQNGFSVILDGEPKAIRKAFSSYVSDHFKWKLKSKSKFLIADDLFTASISEKHFSVKVMTQKINNETELSYFMTYGNDVYVNSSDYPSEALKCKDILLSFSKFYYSAFVNSEIDKINKEIGITTKEFTKNSREIESNKKTQSKAEQKIEKLKIQKLKAEEKIRQMEVKIADGLLEIKAEQEEIVVLKRNHKKLVVSKDEIELKMAAEQATLVKLEAVLTQISKFKTSN